AISIGVLALLGVLVFSAFAHRFGWSPVPTYGSLAGDALVALGLFINLLVFKENSYGGSTIETVADQKLISTGPYAFVRHPMYVGVLIMITGSICLADPFLAVSFSRLFIRLASLTQRASSLSRRASARP